MSGSTPSRPLVWINCAVSVDGRLAFAGGARARLSGPADLERVQRLRADSDGIAVGAGTVRLDDPSLHVHWERIGRSVGRPPSRIVLDAHGQIPESAKVLDGSAPTIVATTEESARRYPAHVDRLVVGPSEVGIEALWSALYARGLRRILVEGGAHVIGSVLAARAWDRFTVFVAPLAIGDRAAPPLVAGPAARGFAESARMRLLAVERLDDGYVASYAPGAEDGPPPGA